MTTPTETLLAELTRLHEAGTPGPMQVYRRDAEDGFIDYGVCTGGAKDFATCAESCDPNCRNNAELIAASRNSLPILLEMLRVAREALFTTSACYNCGGCCVKSMEALARLDELAKGALK